MSEDLDSDHDTSPTPLKAKRIERSCDLCRRRKVRCDGPQKANFCCSSCTYLGRECKYEEPAKKRGPRSKALEGLRKQVALLEGRLRALSVCSLCAQPLPDAQHGMNASIFQQNTSGSDSPASEQDTEQDDDPTASLSAHFSRLGVSLDPKLYGEASNYALANKAIAFKEQYTGQRTAVDVTWDIAPWEQVAYEQKTNYVFPESDLVASLLALYFEEFHPTFPILHRPSFERSVAEGLHRQDPQFGATLLAVLATGARYSNDPRVFIDGHTQSSGWNFIKQVPFAPRWFEPNIYEVQFYFIMTLYFVGTSRPLVSWTYLGTGMRFLIQRGEHDRKRGQNTTQELELWNRAFWSFICLDRLVCGSIGRPVGLNPEDIDTDLPLDDESWDHDFLQPPTKHAYLICYVELCEILASAMRRLYGSKKSKTMQGRDSPEWEQRVVSELESRMNKCFDSFPPHLRWDPDRVSTGASFDQSLVLHATYHWTRMIIYRPYIHKTSILAAPSLFICTSAARAVICAAHSWVKSGRSLLPQPVVSPLFVSIIVIFMGTFSTSASTIEKDKALVQHGLDILKNCDLRRQSEGRMWKILHQLTTVNPLSIGDDERREVRCAAQLYTRAISNVFRDPARGLSIEELLAETADLSTLPSSSNGATIDDELMRMWMLAPNDLSDVWQWDSYVQQNPAPGFSFLP